MAESSTITREMIEAGARAYDRDTLRKAGWTEPTIAEMMEDREPSPSSLEASELILRAALATGGGDAWEPLQSAPQDGEVFLVASIAGTGPTLCSFADGYFRLVSNREKLAGYGIWFWQRLPAPPSAALATGGARG